MFKVENEVPLPAPRPYTKYPFHDMKVGDSFAIPAELIDKASRAAYAHGKAHGMRFTTRTLEDGSGRCWRVE